MAAHAAAPGGRGMLGVHCQSAAGASAASHHTGMSSVPGCRLCSCQHAGDGVSWHVSVQYGTQKKGKPRLLTKSGKTRHLMFRKHAQGKL